MATIKKAQAGGVMKPSNPKSPDKKGNFIAVQKKTLAKGKTKKCLKCGGKVKKGKK